MRASEPLSVPIAGLGTSCPAVVLQCCRPRRPLSAGNSRGNGFSRNHTGLDPGKAEFWDFSWDEMAAFDVPAMVSHVLQQSELT